MSYKLESENHALFLRRSLTNWTKNNPDVILISSDGQKMHCHRVLLRFYSSFISSMFSSSSGEDVAITLPVSSTIISNFIKVLTAGLVMAKKKSDLEEVALLAQSLGVTFENWQIGVKKRNVGVNRDSRIENSSKKEQPQLENLQNGVENSILCTNSDSNIESSSIKEEEAQKKVKFLRRGRKGIGCTNCDLCGKIFGTKWKMNRHRNIHYNQRNSGIVCEICNVSFADGDLLESHNLMHHTESATNDEDNDSSATLEEHLELTCDECGKTFSQRKHLMRHKLIHTGQKLPCPYCSSQFSRKDKLNKHVRDHHPDTDVSGSEQKPQLAMPMINDVSEQKSERAMQIVNDVVENQPELAMSMVDDVDEKKPEMAMTLVDETSNIEG